MNRLDDRLIAVATQIRSKTHVDIGSDHASLLAHLLDSRRIQNGIAIENKQLPYENSARALRDRSAEVRLGDGLDALQIGEANSLSLCGLGAESIRNILLAHPDRIPDHAVLQVFHKPEIIRAWAFNNGFHLQNEATTTGKRRYTILSYRRCEIAGSIDSAYQNVDRESALLFGPFVLQREDRQFDAQLQNEEAWWRKHVQLSKESAERLKLIRRVMKDRGIKAVT